VAVALAGRHSSTACWGWSKLALWASSRWPATRSRTAARSPAATPARARTFPQRCPGAIRRRGARAGADRRRPGRARGDVHALARLEHRPGGRRAEGGASRPQPKGATTSGRAAGAAHVRRPGTAPTATSSGCTLSTPSSTSASAPGDVSSSGLSPATSSRPPSSWAGTSAERGRADRAAAAAPLVDRAECRTRISACRRSASSRGQRTARRASITISSSSRTLSAPVSARLGLDAPCALRRRNRPADTAIGCHVQPRRACCWPSLGRPRP
jgi:hypothetical protein